MSLKDLPQSLLRTSLHVIENEDVLESCPSCGAVAGSCLHTDGIKEDEVSKQNIPGADDQEMKLSNQKTDVIINPEYVTFTRHRH